MGKIETDETPDDIDEHLLKSYIDKANQCGRISQEYTDKISTLKKLGLLSNGHLNNAGRVLFSSNKPVCLKLAVFATDEKLTFIDTQVFNGNLFELIDKGQEYIKEHINFSAEIVGTKRIETPEIPLEAIREAVVNSLCHSSLILRLIIKFISFQLELSFLILDLFLLALSHLILPMKALYQF